MDELNCVDAICACGHKLGLTEIVAMMEWDSMEDIQAFVEESDVDEVRAKSGVVGEPEWYILNEAE